MDNVLVAVVVVVVLFVVLGLLAWRPQRRRRTPEEALEEDHLRREFDRHHTDAVYHRDRNNLP